MAITDIARYTHLSPSEIQSLGDELDAIRLDIEDSLGERDAAYIRRTIRFQRLLDFGARVLIGTTRSRTGWALGTTALAFAKIIENMEIGHNVSHGQWDWMNDPESPRRVRRLPFLGRMGSCQVVRRGGTRPSCVSGRCEWSPRSAISTNRSGRR